MISILLATHNGGKYLSQSIDSVLNQSYKDFELLVGLNATTDNSKDILLNYNDLRIKIFYYEEKGKAKTLNKLIKEAKYDWIALQDDDDIWLPLKLEEQIKWIKYYDVIGTFINYIDTENKILGDGPKLKSSHNDIVGESLRGLNQVANTSAIFKKIDAEEINGWREDLDGIEDFDFWLRLMRRDKKFINIPNKLVNHRLHGNSKFNTKHYDLKKIL